jgi:hypothetical protein
MLKKIDNVDFSRLLTFKEVTSAAGNAETVHQLEDVLMIWYKQIEQVRASVPPCIPVSLLARHLFLKYREEKSDFFQLLS